MVNSVAQWGQISCLKKMMITRGVLKKRVITELFMAFFAQLKSYLSPHFISWS